MSDAVDGIADGLRGLREGEAQALQRHEYWRKICPDIVGQVKELAASLRARTQVELRVSEGTINGLPTIYVSLPRGRIGALEIRTRDGGRAFVSVDPAQLSIWAEFNGLVSATYFREGIEVGSEKNAAATGEPFRPPMDPICYAEAATILKLVNDFVLQASRHHWSSVKEAPQR
jgi:hypothetical protein